ncbi:hypothetical protein COU57_05550 [Candidatus Pacearchaeota archaeon CG10_big_fil_rev_8_21_14_0_10_32_14]|nr:MAG: hypothetical protein COU57_05550 [Candidatus Pacearchaeota archaeon CG10_big_fil_rev_8_21_14_0_10_32_14]
MNTIDKRLLTLVSSPHFPYYDFDLSQFKEYDLPGLSYERKIGDYNVSIERFDFVDEDKIKIDYLVALCSENKIRKKRTENFDEAMKWYLGIITTLNLIYDEHANLDRKI